MSESIKITGMVLTTMPIGEYDRRIVLLTTDRGKISGFARGARRQGSSIMAAAQPFVYGEFTAYEGRTSYTFTGARVIDYFDGIREDIEAYCYGSYFLELAEYFTRENEDDYRMLELLYRSVKALLHGQIDKRLVRSICELKILALNGIYPDFFHCAKCGRTDELDTFSVRRHAMLCKEHHDMAGAGAVHMSPAAVYAAQYIIASPLKKLYSFSLEESAFTQLRAAVDICMRTSTDKKFKSLEILEDLLR